MRYNTALITVDYMMKNFIEHNFKQLERIDGPNGRVYNTPSGNKYPSVTSVVSLLNQDEIKAWRARVGEEEANRISARASKRGTQIHSLCEDYLYGKDPQPGMFDAQVFNSLKPHLDLIDNIHALESKLYSDKLQVAGTTDCIAEYKGKLSVIDFKTSRRIKAKEDISGYFIQCSSYAYMFWEQTGIMVDNIVIIMGVDEEDALVFEEPIMPWIKDFIKLRELYRHINGI